MYPLPSNTATLLPAAPDLLSDLKKTHKNAPIRGLHPVMHVDLIMIKTLSPQLHEEKLQPHATTDFKCVGSTFLIGQRCQMAEHQSSSLNLCQQLQC